MWKYKLWRLRSKIDKIDDKVLFLLYKRFLIIKRIGQLKKKNGMKIKDKEREREILKNLRDHAKKFGLNEKFVNSVFDKIIKEARKKEYKDG